MVPLHRHQLVRLGDEGWRRVRVRPWDDEAAACLAHWAAQRLPLVVTRQASGISDTDEIAVGLPAPLCWQRRRIALAVERRDVAWFDEFPRIDALEAALPTSRRAAWRDLAAALSARGATARVYGSHGWQLISGLAYVHPRSDIDLWVAVDDAAQADAVAAVLAASGAAGLPRIDGELVFADGRAVAWREWQAWRAGRCAAVLAKTLHGALLLPGGAFFADLEAVAC